MLYYQERNTVTGAWRENTVTATIARYFPVVNGACLCLCAFLCHCYCGYCKVFPLYHWCLHLLLILMAIQMDNTDDQQKGTYSKTSSVTQMHTSKCTISFTFFKPTFLLPVQAWLWTRWLWKGLQGSLKEVQCKNCDQKSHEKSETTFFWKVIDLEIHIIACVKK